MKIQEVVNEFNRNFNEISGKEISLKSLFDIAVTNYWFVIGIAVIFCYVFSYLDIKKGYMKVEELASDDATGLIILFILSPFVVPIYFVCMFFVNIWHSLGKCLAAIDLFSRKKVVSLDSFNGLQIEDMENQLKSKGYNIVEETPITSPLRNRFDLFFNGKKMDEYRGNRRWCVAQAYHNIVGKYQV